MGISTKEISEVIKERLKNFDASLVSTDIGRIVTVVFLRGGRPTYGPKAAEIAGRMYRNLYDHNFFVARSLATPPTPDATIEKVGATPAQQE